jgi:L-ribulose-5-phosphate 4-epimerase
MLDELRAEVCEANRELQRRGLVIEAFGNASGIDRERGLVAIKPSGLPCDTLTPDTLVVTDMEGRSVAGELRPSSDLPTHLALYKAFPGALGVVHTHSRYATSWAQAGREIPCFGTTHADYFPGPIPITDEMRAEEIASAYEWNTGQAIVRRFDDIDPEELTAVLVRGHGPFCWGRGAREAAHTAAILEELARLAYQTVLLDASAAPIPDALRDKHYRRKHGKGAYYGQG